MRKNLIRKLKENRIVVIIICVIIITIVYFVAQKAIDKFIFDSNTNVISEEELVIESDENAVDESPEGKMQREDGTGQISEEEIDLVVSEEQEDTNENVSNESKEELRNRENGENSQTIETKKIYVYITGEVNNPGVVILNEGSRIVDAINAAGGTTIKANVSKVNLVYVLDDGMKVNIPNNNDLKDNHDFEYITMNSGDGGNDDYLVNSSNENSSSGNLSSSSSESSKNYSIVNINTATQTELETLPGIGPSLALKIINYRKENGKFSSIEEIKNVSGIGDNKFENLKEYITI